MVAIRPKDLIQSSGVGTSDAIIVDNGVSVRQATPAQVVDAAAPVASQAEAEAGTENTKRMTALRVKQAINQLSGTTKANAAALGVSASSNDMGTFTGSIISDSNTAKGALQELETAVENCSLLTPQLYGAVGDGDANDTVAWNTFQAASGLKAIQPGSYFVGSPIPAGTDPYIVLAAGQSNMVGYSGSTGGTFKRNTLVNIWMALTDGGTPQWVNDPDFENVTYYVPVDESGFHELGGGTSNLAYAFAHRLAEKSNRAVWLIIDAYGGSSIDDWVASGTSSERYASLEANIASAFPGITGTPTEVQFFLWQQGEADYLDSAATHQANMETLYTQLSAESWWNDDTVFISGLPVERAEYANIKTAIQDFSAVDPGSRKIAEIDGLSVEGDNVHFTGASLWALGYDRYWKDFVNIRTFNGGVIGNGDYDYANYAHAELATDGGNKLKDSLLVHHRYIDNGQDSLYSGPTIATQTHINLEVPDTETSFTDFKQFYGATHELILDGYYDFQDDGNHNYSTGSFSTRNRMAGLMGSTALCCYSYDAKESENSNISTMGATKTGTMYLQTTRRARYASGGYTLAHEIYSLNQSDDVDTDIPYTNNDTGSFTSFDYSLKLTAGGAGAPITNAIAITGLGSKHGYWNGISIGGTASRINNDTQGPAGTVAINMATQRAATGFFDNGIRYGTNNRHHYYARESAKSRSDQHRFINEAGSSTLSIEAGPSGSHNASVYFRRGATTAFDAGYSSQTSLGEISANVGTFAITSTGGFIRLKPNDTVSGVGYDVNTVRLTPFSSADGVPHLGGASQRWNTVYAATGAINTSDEDEKNWIGRPEDRREAEALIARRISDELGWYQWLDAIQAKGEMARWHYGARAQKVWQIVADAGLCAPLVDDGGKQYPDPSWGGPPPPAWLCWDSWEAQPEQRIPNRVKVKEPVYEQVEVKPARTFINKVVVKDAVYEQILVKKAYIDPKTGEEKPAQYRNGKLLEEAVYEEQEYEIPAEYDDGELLEEAVYEEHETVIPAVKAGSRFGFRVDQLALFLIAQQHIRLNAIEAKLAA